MTHGELDANQRSGAFGLVENWAVCPSKRASFKERGLWRECECAGERACTRLARAPG